MRNQGFNLVSHPDGTILKVRVSPGASRNRVMGEHAGALKISVTSPPEKGKANKSILKMLAELTGISENMVSLVSGASSKSKKVLFEGMKLERLQKILEKTLK